MLLGRTFLVFFLTTLSSNHVGLAYKILVFSPTASKSHMISQGRIADELARAGHDVVNFEPDFTDQVDNFTPCKLCRRWVLKGLNNRGYIDIQNKQTEHIFEQSSFWSRIFNTESDPHQDEYTNLCEEIVTNSSLIAELRAEKFDAYFGEHVHLCGMGLAHLLNIPRKFWVASCTMGVNMRDILGLTTPSSFLPFMSELDETPAPIFQRVKNQMLQMAQLRDEKRDDLVCSNMYRRHFGKHFPGVDEIARDVDIVFVSTDELLEIQSPSLPKIVHIGGLGSEENSGSLELKEEEFKEQMVEKARNGVILFSLGTIANTSILPESIMQNLLKITQQFRDYNFIIKVDKYDGSTFEKAKGLENVHVTNWVPQPAILAHPNIKLFITHAGYNSLMEAARAGVPLLTIPFMFDQHRNSRHVERKGWGLARSRFDLIDHPQRIEQAIREVLTNEQFYERAQRLKHLMLTKPQTAAEKLVKTTKWVLDNHGVDELQYDGRKLGVITYHNLDVVGCILIVVVFIFALLRLTNLSQQKIKKE